jgi:hypothetical protein
MSAGVSPASRRPQRDRCDLRGPPENGLAFLVEAAARPERPSPRISMAFAMSPAPLQSPARADWWPPPRRPHVAPAASAKMIAVDRSSQSSQSDSFSAPTPDVGDPARTGPRRGHP